MLQRRSIRRVCLCVLALCFLSANLAPASAQQTTDVSGRVLQRQKDGSVAPAQFLVGLIPGKNSGAMVTTESDANGNFSFAGIPPAGSYSLVVIDVDANGGRRFVTGITDLDLAERDQYTIIVEIEQLAAARKRPVTPPARPATPAAPSGNAPRRVIAGIVDSPDTRLPADPKSPALQQLMEKANQLYDGGKTSEALPVAKELLVLTIRERGAESVAVGQVYNLLGLVQGDLGDQQAAIESHRNSLRILERALRPTHLELAPVLYNLATELDVADGDLEQAEALYRRALDIRTRTQGAEHPDLSFPLKGLARVFQDRGDYKQSEAFYLRALALSEKGYGPEDDHTVEIMSDLGTLYSTEGKYPEAEQSFLKVLRLDEKRFGPKHPTVAKSASNVGSFYLGQGDFRKAEEYIQRSLDIRRETLGENHPDLADSFLLLGQLYSLTNQSTEALALFLRAVEIEEKAFGKNSPSLVQALARLSTMYQEMQEYDKAEALLNRERDILQQAYGGIHPLMPPILSNLAALYRDHQRDYPRAEALYQQAIELEIKFRGPDHPNVAEILSSEANLYLYQGNYAKAEALHLRALAIEEKTLGPDHRDVATTFSWLAEIYRAEGNVAKAIETMARGNQIREIDLLKNLAGGSERQKMGIQLGYMLETEMTVSLNQQLAPDNDAATRLALTTILQRKGRALEGMGEVIRLLRRRGDAGDLKLLADLTSTKTMLATFTVSGFSTGTPIAEQHEDVAYLDSKSTELEWQISQRAAPLRGAPTPLKLEEVQRLIPPDAALVEFYSYQPYQPSPKPFLENLKPARYVAYVLLPTGAPKSIDLGDAAAIDEQAAAWRASLREDKSTDAKALGRALDQRVMQPVRKLLGTTRRLLLSPDGNLNLIPFGALVDESDHFLLENYSISYLSTGRDLLRLQDSFPARQSAVIVADPIYDLGRDHDPVAASNKQEDANGFNVNFTKLLIKQLPGTRDEAIRLKALMPDAQVFLGDQATEFNVKQVTGPSILHLATHGYFFSNSTGGSAVAGRQLVMVDPAGKSGSDDDDDITPMLASGLVLSGVKNRLSGEKNDGVLTAMEVTGLDLWGTKLVVLSACETGLGWSLPGEGVFGLRRALALAGSESQVISLWKVDDQATGDLMADFYGRLLKGTGRTEALRQAQLDMLHDSKRVHPYYWAAFIQSGAWTNLAGK
jgi:CHAT domain-containing protein